MCLGCGQMEHFIEDFPYHGVRPMNSVGSVRYLASNQPTQFSLYGKLFQHQYLSNRGLDQPPCRGRLGSRLVGRVYSTIMKNLQSYNLIIGTLLLGTFFIIVLFNIRATHFL